MDDLMRILKTLYSHFGWAARQSLKLFGIEIKKAIRHCGHDGKRNVHRRGTPVELEQQEGGGGAGAPTQKKIEKNEFEK